jgi:hypothetical protein
MAVVAAGEAAVMATARKLGQDLPLRTPRKGGVQEW